MKSQQGFTLIELMIVVSVIAILSSIAYTSYQSSVKKSNRAEAKTELMEVAAKLQRCYTMYGRYHDPDDDDLCQVFELMEAGAITSTGRGFYTVDLVSATTTEFTLKAVPVRTPQINDKDCKELLLTHTGTQTAKNFSNGDSTSKCW